jgi:hypothetical protein
MAHRAARVQAGAAVAAPDPEDAVVVRPAEPADAARPRAAARDEEQAGAVPADAAVALPVAPAAGVELPAAEPADAAGPAVRRADVQRADARRVFPASSRPAFPVPVALAQAGAVDRQRPSPAQDAAARQTSSWTR